MTKTYVTVPKSFLDYLDKRPSLDILDKQEIPPLSFDLDNVIKFNKAKASLEACKYEFYDFMIKFYQQVWGQALNNKSLKPLKLAERCESTAKDHFCSIANVWEDRAMFWVYSMPRGNFLLWLQCELDDKSRLLSLYCAACDKDTRNWKLGGKNLRKKLDASWKESEEGDIYLLEKNSLPFGKKVDVTSLTMIATKALKDILK